MRSKGSQQLAYNRFAHELSASTHHHNSAFSCINVIKSEGKDAVGLIQRYAVRPIPISKNGQCTGRCHILHRRRYSLIYFPANARMSVFVFQEIFMQILRGTENATDRHDHYRAIDPPWETTELLLRPRIHFKPIWGIDDS